MTSQTAKAQRYDADREFEHKHRWTILVIVSIAQLMVVLDATIVNIALPAAQDALGFADADRQWVVTAYALAFGSLLLLGGKLGDLFGRKRMFMIGLVGFAVASAAGGASTDFMVLVISRAAQGAFGALLAPAALSTITNSFSSPAERGRAFGVYGAVAGGGGAVGLLLGGVLTEYASWRWCFFVNLVFAGIAWVGGQYYLRNETSATKPKIDWLGTVCAVVGLFLLVYGFSRAASDGWGDIITVISLVVSALLLVSFVQLERRVRQPLLPLRIVKDRSRGGAYLSVGLAAIAIFGVFLFLTFYLQLTKGYSPVLTGVAFLPMIAFVLIGSTLANVKLMPILGARMLITIGMALSAVGMAYLYFIDSTSNYWVHILPSLPVLGFGFGLIFAPAINTATERVNREDAGVASALVNTTQQVGGSIGTALLSSIAASVTTTYAATHVGAAAAAEAPVAGYKIAFLVSAGIFAVGAVLIFFLIQPHAPQPSGAPPDDDGGTDAGLGGQPSSAGTTAQAAAQGAVAPTGRDADPAPGKA
ncbi:MFS transporter [Asanoa ishikariensis]|uniref:Drug resistance transporter, EmrB/QacA subfamily n=1 Tax=Asanoa ishikariensis TaxID=137265 RepID=A0A1H3S7W6_9ACTN|nr:MFS transporter [Asanoa ishikariensis]GIF66458.1 MFS transporter [Asanoa ishikariensis]SDZ33229.1 drug resistance transporter, EmrB/QacA subfamily [Asanoa ishikariensis]